MNQTLDKIYDSLLSSYHSKDYDEYVRETSDARDEIKKLKPPSPDDFKPYPKLTDPNFNERVYSKKEFHRYQLRPEYHEGARYNDVAQEKCFTNDFKLTANQKLLKNFLSPLTPFNSLLLYHGVGVGKCHARDTPIIMYDGSIRMVQDIIEGDLLMGDDGTPRTVLSLARGRDVMYEVLPHRGGTPFTVNSEHILCLKDVEGLVHEITVQDYVDQATGAFKDMFLYRARVDDYRARVDEMGKRDVRLKTLADIIDRCGIESVQGLILRTAASDTDDICFLARSLGIGAHKDDACTISLFGEGLRDVPLRSIQVPSSCLLENGTQTTFDVVMKPEDDYYGFMLDGNNRYLLGDFTVTHNTC